jgi:hypothetical protein
MVFWIDPIDWAAVAQRPDIILANAAVITGIIVFFIILHRAGGS